MCDQTKIVVSGDFKVVIKDLFKILKDTTNRKYFEEYIIVKAYELELLLKKSTSGATEVTDYRDIKKPFEKIVIGRDKVMPYCYWRTYNRWLISIFVLLNPPDVDIETNNELLNILHQLSDEFRSSAERLSENSIKIVFDQAIKIAEYEFDNKEFIFYTTTDAYQQYLGYYDFYDEFANTGPLFRIDYLKIPVYVRGTHYNIRVWKGNYWGAAGGEIGYYTGDGPLKIIAPYIDALLKSLDNKENVKMAIDLLHTIHPNKFHIPFEFRDLFKIKNKDDPLDKLQNRLKKLTELLNNPSDRNIEEARNILQELKSIVNEEASGASKKNMLYMGFVLKDTLGRIIFTKAMDTNWWVIGLKPFENFTQEDTFWKDMRKKEYKYSLEGTIDFKTDGEMANEFIDGLKVCGFSEAIKNSDWTYERYSRQNNVVKFCWKSGQWSTRQQFQEELEERVRQRADDILKNRVKGKSKNDIATSRCGDYVFPYMSNDYENFRLAGFFKKTNDTELYGVENYPELQEYKIFKKNLYMIFLKEQYKNAGIIFNKFMKDTIENYIDSILGKNFHYRAGLPGCHAEIKSVNDVFNKMMDDKKNDLINKNFNFNEIDTATYGLVGEVARKKFPCCVHCRSILIEKIGVNVITERKTNDQN